MEADGIGREEGQEVAAGAHARRFPKAERLRRSGDIQLVLSRGSRHSLGGMQLLTAERPGRAGTRAGFIVKRKLGCACMRNLMKRRMREAYRDVKHRLGPGRDLVVSATAVLDYKAVRRNLEELLARSGAIENHGKPE